jgi:hypothetical protein
MMRIHTGFYRCKICYKIEVPIGVPIIIHQVMSNADSNPRYSDKLTLEILNYKHNERTNVFQPLEEVYSVDSGGNLTKCCYRGVQKTGKCENPPK